MTRERAKELAPIIAAWGIGKMIQFRRNEGDDYEWHDFDCGGCDWYDNFDYRIKPAPSLRPMTRGEVLHKVTTTPGMVARAVGCANIFPAVDLGRWDHPERAEYAIIDKHGNPIDGWHKFETTDDPQ